MEGGRGLLLQLSSHINEHVIRREVCPYGGSVVLETKTGLKPNHCRDLFVDVEPQTHLGPSVITLGCSCWKGSSNATFLYCFLVLGSARSRKLRVNSPLG